MRLHRALVLGMVLAMAIPALTIPLQAQEDMGAAGATPAPDPGTRAAPKAPGESVPAEAAPVAPPGTMIDMRLAQLQALDKITARVSTIDLKVGDTATFGSLNVVVRACRKSAPEDTPEAAAFVQIWEQKPGEDSHWVYSGWMFASSPSLAAMDHPVYDIWVVDCKKDATSAASSVPAPSAVPATLPPPDPTAQKLP